MSVLPGCGVFKLECSVRQGQLLVPMWLIVCRKHNLKLPSFVVNAIEFIVQLSTKYGSEIDYDTASVIKSCGGCQQFYATCQKRIADLESILVHSNSKVEVKTTATTTPTSTGEPETVEIDEVIDFESENKEDMSVKIEPMEESEKLD